LTKKDLYKKLREDFPHLKAETIKGALDVIFETITEGLVERKDTVIRGIGSFVTFERKMPKSNFKTFKLEPKEEKETFVCVRWLPSRGLKERLWTNDGTFTRANHSKRADYGILL
jgi:nucleoid DNA-binding protein